jgi:hypothetical protein
MYPGPVLSFLCIEGYEFVSYLPKFVAAQLTAEVMKPIETITQ